MSEFDDHWFENFYRCSISKMKLFDPWDIHCPRPFCVIGYDSRMMTFSQFQKKILKLKVDCKIKF